MDRQSVKQIKCDLPAATLLLDESPVWRPAEHSDKRSF
jgi:hypothetical protein